MGIIVFSYTSQIFLPTLEGSLRDRRQFIPMLNWSHIMAAAFKSIFGFLGFLTWGFDTEEVITNNLPTEGFKGFVNFILVIKAVLSYPLPFFAAIDLLNKAMFLGDGKTKYPSCFTVNGEMKTWGMSLRVLTIVFTIILAVLAVSNKL